MISLKYDDPAKEEEIKRIIADWIANMRLKAPVLIYAVDEHADGANCGEDEDGVQIVPPN